MKTVLVTGGAGFVGTNLIKRLIQKGYEVVSIDNYSTGFVSNHQVGCNYRIGDVSEITDYSVYGKFDIVYHLAAIARIQPSFEMPLEYFKANATATFNIAMYCAKNNIPMQFAGSSSHHSGKFKNPYTFAKDVSEEIVVLCEQIYGLKATITRFYNVYGPHHLKTGGYCTLLGNWERCLETGEQIVIYGDGSKRRDFTHVDDIVDALIMIFEQHQLGYEFELGRNKNYSVSDIAKLYNISNIEYLDDKPGEADETLCTDTTAHNILGWNPCKNIEDYIKDYLCKK